MLARTLRRRNAVESLSISTGHYSMRDGAQWSGELETPRIRAVACPRDGFCIAVNGGNAVWTYTGGNWQHTDQLGDTDLGIYYNLSCTATVSCTAINTLGYARTYRAVP